MSTSPSSRAATSPWPALWALVIGFFMILVDATIVSVAMPSLMTSFDASVNQAMWVTSAYLLAYAVPLLTTGRLGDRFGPKRVYLTGLTIFTLASLWCGLTGELGMGIWALVAARVVQGLGASMMTPQTMAVITRTFPAERRGTAMALWGATAGVATLSGPLLGGILIDTLGWEWIFFVNVPVGVLGLVLAAQLVPQLTTHSHRFDRLGMVLSAVGLFCVVFGIQEGQTYGWGQINGFLSVPLLIGVGAVLLGVFLLWQAVNRGEPLVPLRLFRDRNFSLASGAITTMGFTSTALIFPVMIWAQSVRDLSPTMAAVLIAPSSLMALAFAPLAGKLTDGVHPRILVGTGTGMLALSLFLLAQVMTPGSPLWQAMAVMVLNGLANPLIWGPLATTATRNLPPEAAGAGSGVYNTTRQMGAVLGSAAVAMAMQARLTARLGEDAAAVATGAVPGDATTGAAPVAAELAGPYSQALAEALYLPMGVILLGFLASLFFATPRHMVRAAGGGEDSADRATGAGVGAKPLPELPGPAADGAAGSSGQSAHRRGLAP